MDQSGLKTARRVLSVMLPGSAAWEEARAIYKVPVYKTHYISLIYMVFALEDPLLRHSLAHWVALAVICPIFLFLYLQVPVLHGRKRVVVMTLLCLMGLAYLPFNHSSQAMLVYPMAMLPFLVEDGRKVFAILVPYLAAILGVGLWTHLSVWTYGLGMFLVVAVTLSNLYAAEQVVANRRLSMAHDEIEKLAKLAERERISRDLHDVLGHTLTLVVLKLQLVETLIADDPGAARKEVAEIEHTARKALREVREAVQGYRSQGLPDEFKRAEHTLRVAGIETAVEIDNDLLRNKIGAEQEAVLTLVLREAITNVVRHSLATLCEMSLKSVRGKVALEVKDNGNCGARCEGFGIRGMRERVESAGGELEIVRVGGTTIRARLP